MSDHQFVEFKITPVVLISSENGETHAVANPDAQPKVTYGCITCNMGVDEALQSSCPGFDLFEEQNDYSGNPSS